MLFQISNLINYISSLKLIGADHPTSHVAPPCSYSSPERDKPNSYETPLNPTHWTFKAQKECVFVCLCYLWPQLSADVIGVQGEQRLPCSDVQNPLVVGQSQHAVVEHSLNAEPRHAVQHIWMRTHRRIITSLTTASLQIAHLSLTE